MAHGALWNVNSAFGHILAGTVHGDRGPEGTHGQLAAAVFLAACITLLVSVMGNGKLGLRVLGLRTISQPMFDCMHYNRASRICVHEQDFGSHSYEYACTHAQIIIVSGSEPFRNA